MGTGSPPGPGDAFEVGASHRRPAGHAVMPSETHIVPVHVGDPERCKSVSKLLLWKHGIYIQPINYPTVPRGHERLRITPSPCHSDELMDHLAVALTDVWDQLNLPSMIELYL
jgi:5-aminolevulinate synthase